MKSLFSILLFSLTLLFVTGCPGQKLQQTSSDGMDEVKSEKVNNLMRQGNITDAVDTMVQPPCVDCARRAAMRSSRARSGKFHMIAEVGDPDCLKKATKVDPKVLGIRVSGATGKDKTTIGHFVGTLVKLAGESRARSLVGGMRVSYVKSLPLRRDGLCLPASQLTGAVQIASYCRNKAQTRVPYREGLLVHEAAHYVGNRSGNYRKYNRFVSSRCKVSSYCYKSRRGRKHRSRNEEFAEAFAAYLTSPKLLKSKCPRAFKYFSEKVFDKQKHSCG